MDAATDHQLRKVGLRRDPAATRAAFVRAAWQEFEEHGFEGTQSSRIARRAGYAPQTFYRHFTDKVDILLAVYASWIADKREAISAAGDVREVARVLLNFHRASRKLRLALRTLSITEERVRAARARSRMQGIAYVRENRPHTVELSDAHLLRSVLLVERLMDAYTEDGIADPAISPEEAEEQLRAWLEREFGQSSQVA